MLFIVIAGLLFLAFYVLILFLSHSPRAAVPSELNYITADGNTGVLPTLDDAASVDLSIVVPCYNESARLPIMLEDATKFLREKFAKSWEMLLVDDGSRDDTVETAVSWIKSQPDATNLMKHIKITKLVKNRGKGGAVTHGMKHSAGNLVLFADADGASRFADVQSLCDAINKPLGVAVGSRAHLVKTEAVVKRTFIRNFLMYGLHTLLYVFGIRTIRDTQCGFKLFTRDACKLIFPYVHTERWIFDVEVLIIAMRKNIPVVEVPISWHEVAGSKIDLARDSLLMAIDLVVIRFAYLLGIYKDR